MSTIIHITKEVIESQHLGDVFLICVEKNGGITIEPNNKEEKTKLWEFMIEEDIRTK